MKNKITKIIKKNIRKQVQVQLLHNGKPNKGELSRVKLVLVLCN